ncbi:mannose-specific PTS system EIID component [Escherichia coli]|nr:mannose-specific PTS system EIID component [Escherichia coli]
MVDTTQTTTEKKLTQSDIRGVFLRSNLFQGSWNFERMQALGFCFSMVPAIRRLYPENNEARKQAIRRHLEFYPAVRGCADSRRNPGAGRTAC